MNGPEMSSVHSEASETESPLLIGQDESIDATRQRNLGESISVNFGVYCSRGQCTRKDQSLLPFLLILSMYQQGDLESGEKSVSAPIVTLSLDIGTLCSFQIMSKEVNPCSFHFLSFSQPVFH